jgi:serine/threonine protein kinase
VDQEQLMSADLQVKRLQLGPLVKLGKGGTAIVYRLPQFSLPDFPNLVYKEYNEKTKALAGPSLGGGLTRFVRFREKLPARQQKSWDERIVWPVLVVVDDEDGAASGIVMPLIPQRFFHNFVRHSGPPESRPLEVDTLFGDDETMMRVGLPQIGVRTRLQLISKVAIAYGMMHREGVVLGDISARNIVYDPNQNDPAILVVDVDSARVAGTRSVFSSQPHTPNWEPPEALKASEALRRGGAGLPSDRRDTLKNTWSIQSKQTDVYKFGLMVVRILDHGRGRAVNREPGPAQRILQAQVGASAAKLLDGSLAANPKDRPSMRDWYEVLSGGGARRAPESGARPPVGSTSNATPKTGIPNGHRVGKWVWKEGTGWIR